MPIPTAKEYGLMQAARAGKLRSAGPSPEVAKEMIDKTPKSTRSRFAKQLAKKRKKNY